VASLPSSRAPPLTKSVRNCGSSALKGVREHEAQQARDGLESRSILESVEPASSLVLIAVTVLAFALYPVGAEPRRR
jgi:hypothetical protein